MPKERWTNPRDQRPAEWHKKVWDYLEKKGVADRYEKTKDPVTGELNKYLLSDEDRRTVDEAESQ